MMHKISSSRKKILVVSDSLAAPRAEGLNWTKYEETWPSLLREKMSNLDICQVSIGSATTTDLLHQMRYWKAFSPDIVIIQAGLVDCLPRALFPLEQRILGKLVPKGLLMKAIHRYAPAIRKFRKRCYTNQNLFYSNVEKFRRIFPCSYWIAIIDGGSDGEKRIPGHLESVKSYNKIIGSVYVESIINPGIYLSEDRADDGFHLSPNGHKKIYDKVVNLINIEFNLIKEC
jgi:lysophospholipase L1-like esterase